MTVLLVVSGLSLVTIDNNLLGLALTENSCRYGRAGNTGCSDYEFVIVINRKNLIKRKALAAIFADGKAGALELF